jgi:hypothetical protein
MSRLYPSKVLRPSKQSLDLPSVSVAPQGSAILRTRHSAVDLMRCDQLNALPAQPFIQRVTVVGSITNQSFGSLLRKTNLEGRLDESDFMRRSTRNGYGDRKTSAICHCHELCTFAPLGFSHPTAPFFAMTKLPSMKHSVKSNLPRSLTSCTSLRYSFSNTPARTHSWKRRWQVWYGGYRSGMSCQEAPVRKIHKMPFRISRSLTRGLPRPSDRLATLGSNGLTTCHCSSLRSIGSLPFSGLSPVYHF